MKRIAPFCLFLACCLALAGCGGGTSNGNSQANANAANTSAANTNKGNDGRGEDGGPVARGVFPTVTVACDFSDTVYENTEATPASVTVQLSDNCEVSDSAVRVLGKDGKQIGDTKSVPDGGTKTITFTVPAGGKIGLDCEGNSGNCMYTIGVK